MTTIAMSKRGTVTIPPAIRRKLGLEKLANPILIVEERDGGLSLQPATAVPVRDLTRGLIEQWIKDDEAEMRTLRSKSKTKHP